MGTSNTTSQTNDPSAGGTSPGSEADQKGGPAPAKEHAERDYEDSPKQDGE